MTDGPVKKAVFKYLPLTISLQTKEGIATPLVLRGTPLPVSRTQLFSTAEDDQTAVTLRLCMGERPMFGDNFELLSADLDGIPKAQRGIPQVEVKVQINQFCEVDVDAFEKSSGKRLETRRKNVAKRLSQDEIQTFLDMAEKSREKDQLALKRAERRVKAQDLINAAEARMATSGHLPDLSKKVASLGLAIESDDEAGIQKYSSELERLLQSNPFGNIFYDVFAKSTSSPSPHNAAGENTVQGSHQQVGPAKIELGNKSIFGADEYTLDPNLCFVLMPFEGRLQPIYEDHVKPVVEGESLACKRADELVGARQITLDIWEHINRARFLLADLTGQNANVFYELGLAHAIGKEVVLLTQSMDFVPFDLRNIRCLVYEYTPPGMRNLEQRLRRTIRELMAE